MKPLDELVNYRENMEILTINEEITKYSKQLGLENVNVFSVKMKDYKGYVIYEGKYPVFESQSLEGIGAHLDIMSLDKKFK